MDFNLPSGTLWEFPKLIIAKSPEQIIAHCPTLDQIRELFTETELEYYKEDPSTIGYFRLKAENKATMRIPDGPYFVATSNETIGTTYLLIDSIYKILIKHKFPISGWLFTVDKPRIYKDF